MTTVQANGHMHMHTHAHLQACTSTRMHIHTRTRDAREAHMYAGDARTHATHASRVTNEATCASDARTRRAHACKRRAQATRASDARTQAMYAMHATRGERTRRTITRAFTHNHTRAHIFHFILFFVYLNSAYNLATSLHKVSI